MDEASILGSLDRIEFAIARIETASRQRAMPAAAAPMEDTDLQQRHVALKTAVENALTRIDTLIADQS